MTNFINSLVLITLLLISSIGNAQQLNQVRAYIAPPDLQTSYFPSKQQVQKALRPRSSVAEEASSFPPLEKQEVFVNQFSTPDVPRAKPVMQFVAPNLMIPNGNGYPQQTLKFPAIPSSINNDNPFSLPSAFPTIPVGNDKGLNSKAGGNNHWNSFPSTSKKTHVNKKKIEGSKRIIWPDVYTEFTDSAWDKTMSVPRKLGRMPDGWRVHYVNTPDPMTASEAVINQFPPIVDEAGNKVDASNWGVFNGN